MSNSYEPDKENWPKFRLVLDGTTITGSVEKGDSGLRPFRSVASCLSEWKLMSLIAGFRGEWRIEDEEGNIIASGTPRQESEA